MPITLPADWNGPICYIHKVTSRPLCAVPVELDVNAIEALGRVIFDEENLKKWASENDSIGKVVIECNSENCPNLLANGHNISCKYFKGVING